MPDSGMGFLYLDHLPRKRAVLRTLKYPEEQCVGCSIHMVPFPVDGNRCLQVDQAYFRCAPVQLRNGITPDVIKIERLRYKTEGLFRKPYALPRINHIGLIDSGRGRIGST